MANYRIDAVLDQETGKYRARLFFPRGSVAPLAVTSAIYDTYAEATKGLGAVFRAEASPPAEREPGELGLLRPV